MNSILLSIRQLFWVYALHFEQLIVALDVVKRIARVAKVIENSGFIEPWKKRAI